MTRLVQMAGNIVRASRTQHFEGGHTIISGSAANQKLTYYRPLPFGDSKKFTGL